MYVFYGVHVCLCLCVCVSVCLSVYLLVGLCVHVFVFVFENWYYIIRKTALADAF